LDCNTSFRSQHFVAWKILDDGLDLSRTLEIIRENIKSLAKTKTSGQYEGKVRRPRCADRGVVKIA